MRYHLLNVLVLGIVLVAAQAQDKEKHKKVESDTLVSRLEMIRNIEAQIKNTQEQGTLIIQRLDAQKQFLLNCTQDSLRVKK